MPTLTSCAHTWKPTRMCLDPTTSADQVTGIIGTKASSTNTCEQVWCGCHPHGWAITATSLRLRSITSWLAFFNIFSNKHCCMPGMHADHQAFSLSYIVCYLQMHEQNCGMSRCTTCMGYRPTCNIAYVSGAFSYLGLGWLPAEVHTASPVT